MTERVRHPWLFSAFRATLYLCAIAVATLLGLVGVGVLGAILVLGALSVATTGDVNWLAMGGFSVLVVLLVALALGGLSVGVRYVERRVEAANRLPDPLDEVKSEYVADTIDERELERRLDGVLDPRDRRPVSTRHDRATTGHPTDYRGENRFEEEESAT